LTTGLLSQASPVWVFLVAAAIVGVLPTFLVRDPEAYWFGVFVLSMMVEVQKAFGDGLNVMARYGFEIETAPSVSQLLPELRLSDLPLLVLLALWAWKVARHGKPLVFPRVALDRSGVLRMGRSVRDHWRPIPTSGPWSGSATSSSSSSSSGP